MVKKFNTKYGKVSVRNAMIDGDFNDLNEGIEITGESIDLIEVLVYYDLDDMTVNTVETLIELNS